MNKFLLLSSILSLSIANIAMAEKLYQWVDKNGVTHFTREAPDPEQMGEQSQSGPSQELLSEKESYLRERQRLEAARTGTIDDRRRDQIDRQIMALDYNWYRDKDPEKAAQIKQELGKPKLREIPQEQQPANKMDKYKAFY